MSATYRLSWESKADERAFRRTAGSFSARLLRYYTQFPPATATAVFGEKAAVPCAKARMRFAAVQAALERMRTTPTLAPYSVTEELGTLVFPARCATTR